MKAGLFFLLCLFSFASSAVDTELKFYRPFGEVYNQKAAFITNKVSGVCTSQSLLILREDAWHCEANGQVFDPCFVNAGTNKKEALCPQSPWSGASTLIEVDSPLNNEHHVSLDMSRTFPWAVELTNGEYCQAIISEGHYDSMPIHYQCSNQNLLIGYLQRCKPTWSMLEKTTTGVDTADFKKVWF